MTPKQPARSGAAAPAPHGSPAAEDTDSGLRYADALAELEQILEDLESDSIDVDDLAARVRRASQLIAVCRQRLTRTKLEIEQIVKDLEAFEDESAGGEDGEGAEDSG